MKGKWMFRTDILVPEGENSEFMERRGQNNFKLISSLLRR